MFTVQEMIDETTRYKNSYDSVVLADFTYSEAGGQLLTDKHNDYSYDVGTATDGFDNLSKHLGVPSKLAMKLPPKMREDLINHFLEQESNKEVNITLNNNIMLGIHNSNKPLIMQNKVAEMISTVFKPTDSVSKFSLVNGFQAFIHTPELYVDARPGDRTQGGVYVSSLFGEVPTVSVYMERLVCSNGMVALSEYDKVRVTGQSNSEIIENMKLLTNLALDSTIPDYLNNWKKMTTIKSTNPEQLIHRLAKENGINSKLESSIMEAASSLTNDSYYDIVNLITNFQHADGIEGSNQLEKLQVLGGNAIRDLGGHRCNNCQHSLEI